MTAAAAAWIGDGQGVQVPGEAVGLDIDGVSVRLWRVVDLEQFVDADALLRGDDATEPPYWMHLWPGALVATLAASTAPHGMVWLADSVNAARRSLAVRLEAAGFTVEAKHTQESEDGHPVWVRLLAARRGA
jgi:hypothetical protein